MKKVLLLSSFCLVIVVFSCNQSGTDSKKRSAEAAARSDDSLYNIARTLFKPLPPVAESKTNPITDAKVNLGKILYYDTRLSKNGDISCNTCHNLQEFGAETEPTSVGEEGQVGTRNSPTVFNAALQNMQFWDGRAKDVEEQAGMPILNPVEMAIPHKGFLIDRLKGIPLYQEQFKAAFPEEAQPLTYENLEKAIGAFERTLLTPSKFDQYMQGDQHALTREEKEGLKVFIQSGCPNCHHGVAVGGETLQRFGLVTDYRTLTGSSASDQGRLAVSKNTTDKDVFKVPVLRNVAGTYPYFHDGSIANLDSAVKIMSKVQMNKDLTQQEVDRIIAFLNALTGKVNPEARKIPPELVNK